MPPPKRTVYQFRMSKELFRLSCEAICLSSIERNGYSNLRIVVADALLRVKDHSLLSSSAEIEQVLDRFPAAGTKRVHLTLAEPHPARFAEFRRIVSERLHRRLAAQELLHLLLQAYLSTSDGA